MKYKILFVAMLTLLCTGSFGAETLNLKTRTWTAKSGPTLEANLVRYDNYSVALKGTNGVVISVLISVLSENDQMYIAQCKELPKYVDKDATSKTKILEREGLTFECGNNGILYVSADAYNSRSGRKRVSEWLEEPQAFIDAIDKGLEWCRIARLNNAETKYRPLFSTVRETLVMKHGMQMSFSSAKKEKGPRNVITPEIRVSLTTEDFPYSLDASATLTEDDLTVIVTELKKVPFSLIKEHFYTKRKKDATLFK